MTADPEYLHDPTDDIDVAPVVLDAEQSEPIVLDEVDPAQDGSPPEDWGSTLADVDFDERADGVTVTSDPEDGAPA